MNKLRNLHVFPLKKLLFEQEEEEEEIFGDEEADDKEADEEEADDETPADEASDEDEGGDKEEDEADTSASVENVESIDGDIEAVLIDFETTARRAAVSEASGLRKLYESEDTLDLDSFASDVARLVKNYDNLLDIEGMLINKSKSFLVDRYGEEAASDFIDRLETQHDIEEPKSGDPIPDNGLQTPLAVGAGAKGDQ